MWPCNCADKRGPWRHGSYGLSEATRPIAWPMLLLDLWRTVTNQMTDADLVMVQESEDRPHLKGQS